MERVCIASHELSAYWIFWASEISSPMSLLFRGETEAWSEARSLQVLLGKKTSEDNASPSQLLLPTLTEISPNHAFSVQKKLFRVVNFHHSSPLTICLSQSC